MIQFVVPIVVICPNAKNEDRGELRYAPPGICPFCGESTEDHEWQVVKKDV